MNDMTKTSLIRFLEMMIEKGWVNPSTGGAMRTASKKILSVVPDDTDVSTIDVPMALRQYNNLNAGELSPDSLKVYEQRVLRSIKQFQSYVSDPTSFKPSGRIPSAPKNGKPEKTMRTGSAKQSQVAKTPIAAGSKDEQHARPAHSPHTDSTPHAVATDLNLALPFPLRPNFLAQVVIPRDLTKDEAERMCAFVKALAQ